MTVAALALPAAEAANSPAKIAISEFIFNLNGFERLSDAGFKNY